MSEKPRVIGAAGGALGLGAMMTTSTLTCPQCGHASIETMPIDACIYFHECDGCGTLMRPKAGDCCVFCSYGSVPCPPIQAAQPCCGTPS
jgi:hypothetical protein